MTKDPGAAFSRSDLLAWQRFVLADSHILRENPSLFFQQAANQPERTAPARAAAARFAAGRAPRPWLRWLNKPHSPDPRLLTVGGEGEKVSCGAFLPGGARVLAAAGSGLQIWDIESGVLQRVIPMEGEGLSRCVLPADGRTILFVSPRILVGFDPASLSLRLPAGSDRGGSRWIVSPDGHRAASIALEKPLVTLWDLDEPRPMMEMSGETDPRKPVSFCADGRRAVVNWRKGLELVDLASWSVVAGLEGDIHAAGEGLVATVSGGTTLALWDAGTGARLRTILSEYPIHRLAILPGGRRVLTDVVTQDALDQVVWAHQLWDASSGDLVATLPSGYGAHVSILLEIQTGAVTPESMPGHAFWPDGRFLATWPPSSTDATVWRADTGERLGDLRPHPSWIQSCRVSAAGDTLTVACQDGSLVVWDGRDLSRRATLRGNAGQVLDFFYSPDGTRLAGVSEDGTLSVWGIPDSAESEAPAHQGRVTACAFSLQGDKLLSAATDGLLMMRDPESGERVAALDTGQPGYMAAALAPSGDQAAFVAGQPYAAIRVWDVKTGTVTTLGDAGDGENRSFCRFSADGRHFVAVGGYRHGFTVISGKIAIFRTDPWSEVFSREYGVPVSRFDLSPDSRWALFSLADGTLLQWDFRSGPGAAMREMKGVRAFAILPFGQSALLSRSRSGTQIMQLETQGVWDLPPSPDSLRDWRGFSRGGLRVASRPCRVAMINPRTSTFDLAWEAPDEYFLAFSADGKHAVSCAGAQSVVLRRVEDGNPVYEYYPRGAFNQFVISPDGRTLAVGTMQGEVHLLRLEGAKPKRAPAARTARPRPSGTGAPRIGLNDPCPCGSGKKYRKCHGAG
ncbi:MAG: SEC-C metal-binding domain-containing protein [Candidatus Aminicenantes bacterium RBG_16_66_30]